MDQEITKPITVNEAIESVATTKPTEWVGHAVASALVAEIDRLRLALESVPTFDRATEEELEHEHNAHLIEAYAGITAAIPMASGDVLKRHLGDIHKHLRAALRLDPRS